VSTAGSGPDADPGPDTGLTDAEIEAIASSDGIALRPGEASQLKGMVDGILAAADLVAGLEQEKPELRYPERDPGRRPTSAEDPFNAFIRICRVAGSDSGPLAGMTVGVKDNISVAGVPTTNASRLPPYVPDVDAVVIERLLDAGAIVVGKLNMDDFGAGATGATSAFGPARNPVDPAHSAGGSSGGSGAAVAAGSVDLALGVDQGGSGRIPAAFCGVVTIKATHGLVPSFGVTYIDHTIDVITPMARRVEDVARALEVLAGPDWRDPQWIRGEPTTTTFTAAAGEGVAGLRIGLVAESIEGVECDEAVVTGVERAVSALRDAGAIVEPVSIPPWQHAVPIFLPYVSHLASAMIRSEGEGFGHLGYIDVDRMLAFARARREHSIELNGYVKAWLIADRRLRASTLGLSYGRAQNMRLALRRAISAALQDHDLLLTPTLPHTAPMLLGESASVEERLADTRASTIHNTTPLNLSGHPALSLPSGRDKAGLPTAVQLVGRHWDDYCVFRAAFSLEAASERST
jgi:amidase